MPVGHLEQTAGRLDRQVGLQVLDRNGGPHAVLLDHPRGCHLERVTHAPVQLLLPKGGRVVRVLSGWKSSGRIKFPCLKRDQLAGVKHRTHVLPHCRRDVDLKGVLRDLLLDLVGATALGANGPTGPSWLRW